MAHYKLVDKTNLKRITELLQGSENLVCDLETEGLDCFDNSKTIKFVGFTHKPDLGYVFPYHERYFKNISEILNSCEMLINQDIKFDLKWLLRHELIKSIKPKIFCTHVAEHLLDENQWQNTLDALTRKYNPELGKYLTKQKDLFKKSKYGEGWNLTQWTNYNGGDVDAAFHVFSAQKRLLEKEGLLDLMDFEMKNLKVLCYMEMNGFKIDDQVRRELRTKYEKELKESEKILFKHFGDMNFNSPKQLSEKLYGEYKFPIIKRNAPTKKDPDKPGAPSCDEDTLLKLGRMKLNKVHKQPLLDLLKYRYTSKMYSTYVAGLTDNYIMKSDGKVHCNYKMFTVTGRMSCEGPNLQNIPRNGDIKRLFISSYTNGVLVQGDYSQAELRLLAHHSGDKSLIGAFKSGRDIHQEVAAKVFNIAYEKVTEEQRKFAKQVNFGIVYMIGPLGLSDKLDCSEERARELINDWFREFKRVKRYIDDQKENTIENGFVTNLFGRKRRLPGANYNTGPGRGKLRQGVNSPIQGGAGDLTKWVGTRAHYALKKLKLNGKVVCNVHDSVIIDCKKEDALKIGKMLKSIAENPPIELRVPMKMDIKIGERWSDLKEVSL